MNKQKLNIILTGSINSYSQVFFSDNKFFGTILLIVSFFDIWAGLSGLIAVLSTIITAFLLGYSEFNVKKGTYGFNSLLVGLGTGLTFSPGVESLVIVLFASIITFIISITLEGFFAKYYLPFLSVPFLLGMWMVILASRDLTALGISERGIYTANELYQIGGKALIDIYQWFDFTEWPLFITTYLLSLGAIFFQYNILAGILIALGILIYSRISFLLSIIGFATAFLFYDFIGADITQYGYTYIGFNFILTAIAIGGHFLVPNKYSFLWVIVLLPIVVLFTLSLSKFLLPYQLSVFSLPFNIVVLLFLYFIKLRVKRPNKLKEVVTQLNNPEKNLYFQEQAEKRFKWLEYFPISLPFLGEWNVSQAENGELTHQGEWKYAWDFIIKDKENNQYTKTGDYPEDYYCYNKTVITPANGTVVDIIDGVDDNIIGDVNLVHNWGNSIVIKHTEYLFSQLSHLKKGSFKVKKGDTVKKGDILAHCGNSGRSPYPHLHFQMQSTPFIGSKTLDYPIDHFIKSGKNGYTFNSYIKPLLNDKVSNIETADLIKNALNLIPGQKLKYQLILDNEKTIAEEWDVKTDYYNNTFIFCKQTNSYAHLFNDGSVHYFKSFTGDKNSALYYYYLALYHVPLGFYKSMELADKFPPNAVVSKLKMLIQDFIAPFYQAFKLNYTLKFTEIDNELTPEKIRLNSQMCQYFLNKKVKSIDFVININNNEVSEITTNKISIKIINDDSN
ncbi:MAG: urea transporter [Bacteroidota bacterium]